MGKLYYLRSWCSQTKIIPDASGLHQLSLKIPIFVLLIFSLPSVHNRKILLNFTKNLIPDRGPSVEYSARYFNFVFLRFKIYLFIVAPTFLKRTIILSSAHVDVSLRERLECAEECRWMTLVREQTMLVREG